ncbi:MAG: hypothetical protein JWM80_730, partial [Cyanobacteria bacterium RYN_339]|nr:hypothetical protein [Cyanobacteria bacterium RYN_339]
EYQSTTKKLRYSVRVQFNTRPAGSEVPLEEGLTPLDGSLAGLLDSAEAIAKAGLGAKSYTVILRGSPDGARYDVLGEGAGSSVTLDARTGGKV